MNIINKSKLNSDEILFGLNIADKLKDDNNKLKKCFFI